jgi:hypothetical protein
MSLGSAGIDLLVSYKMEAVRDGRKRTLAETCLIEE